LNLDYPNNRVTQNSLGRVVQIQNSDNDDDRGRSAHFFPHNF
jgi:hypothetical protein